jgi:hypothetical protein
MSSGKSPPRRPLHERSDSDSNTRAIAAVRLVPATPPRLLGLSERDDIYSRTPLPTHPSHILSPGGRGRAKGKDGEQLMQRTLQPPITRSLYQVGQDDDAATKPSASKPKPTPKKRLQIHKDTKTFSLVPQTEAIGEDEPGSPTLSTKSSYSLLSTDLHNAAVRSNSIRPCTPGASSTYPIPTTLAPEVESPISSDAINSSPWNYQIVGGVRKVPKTPDNKQKDIASSEIALPPLPESYEAAASLHDLVSKPSFQSSETATIASENTNYKVYRAKSASKSESPIPAPSSSDSNYQIIGVSSPASSVIHRPQESTSIFENYEVFGDPSPSASYSDLAPPSKYSQESLVVPPLKPRTRRSNESFGYYKSRSRESLRSSPSLNSISSVFSQRETARSLVGPGSLVNLPILAAKLKGPSSWANPLASHPTRSPMNEAPHQWSSQLSTVLSVSDGRSDRGSRSWSDDNWRRSSGFPSTQSRHSRQMLSISSSVALEAPPSLRSISDSLEPPEPAYIRLGESNPNDSSMRMVGDQDEYGDGITDMPGWAKFPSRGNLAGFYNVTQSDNGRTNTIRSMASSRANSMLTNAIPTWARLYYGSGERRYLGAPGSSTEGSDSRSSSFRSYRSGSPSIDHLPLTIYSPRRRPREIRPEIRQSSRASMAIAPAPLPANEGQRSIGPCASRFRTWSLSSVWSPHLRVDKRATRQSMWEPPLVNWSTEGGWFGRRNVQIVMFIAGFIFPFGKSSLTKKMV